MSLKTSGIYSPCSLTVPVKSLSKPIHLAVIGDLHRDAPGFSKRAWAHHVRKLKSLDNLYGILIGDYNDFASTSERHATRDLHESTLKTMDHNAISATERVAKDLEACNFKGFLFALNGNHVWNFETNHLAAHGTAALQERGYPIVADTDHLLAHMLGTTCPGVMTICNLTMDYNGGQTSLKICAAHGKGGGSTVGASLNPIEKMAGNMEADIYIQGHTHQMAAAKRVRIMLRNNKTVHRPLTLIRNGAFLKAYEDGEPNHVVDSMMTPSYLGGSIIRLDLFRDKEKDGTKTLAVEQMVMF